MEFSLILAAIYPLVAVVIDIVVGDPRGLYHPVQGIGWILSRQEAFARKTFASQLKAAGIAAVVVNIVVVYLLVDVLCAIPVLGLLVAIYLAWSGLALGQLIKDGREVISLLDSNRGELAREKLGMLVSRDTADLDDDGVRRTLAETVSENVNDGFVAPFFFLVLGGPALMWAYKTVSTMDSMWGYDNETYRELGYGAAKADDILAFIPARITAFVMLGAGWLMRLNVEAAYENMRDDAAKTKSPNAGWPMATAAWLMGARMGGAATYEGKLVEKPELGPEGEAQWDPPRINMLITMCLVSGVLAAVVLHIYFFLTFLSGT